VSRFVDGVYPVPFAAQDWQRGRMPDENPAVEEEYGQAILDICAREDIDTVFPSWDSEVGILSKNKPRFAARGITVPVPEWPVLRQAMDKHALAELAEKIGCPCPRTYLPPTLADAADLAELIGFPLLLKPRCSSGSRGVRLVMRREQLASTTPPWTARAASSARSCTATSGPCSPRSRRSPPPRSRSRSPR
jgi:biotin carboxylase